MEKIRLLNSAEIDVRVGAIYEKGITLLLYKDARVDMNILDSTFGPLGWKRRHFMCGDTMFCEVSVKDENTGEWVSKTDVGTPSFSEPLKGAASDSFKRACTNLGIGRELYTAPFIWIPIDRVTVKEDNRGKKVVKDRFRVQTISYDKESRSITGIVITNDKSIVVFQYMKIEKESVLPKITNEQSTALLAELKRAGISLGSVLKKHNLAKLSDMDVALWEKAMTALKSQDDRAA